MTFASAITIVIGLPGTYSVFIGTCGLQRAGGLNCVYRLRLLKVTFYLQTLTTALSGRQVDFLNYFDSWLVFFSLVRSFLSRAALECRARNVSGSVPD